MLRLLPLLLLALAPSLPAQPNLVKNGDFQTSALVPWVQTGSGYNPKVEQFDVTGLGATYCFGVQVDKTHVVLTQKVPVTPGIPFLFEADLAGDHPYSHTNGDGGRWEIFVAGTKIDSGSFGSLTGFQTKRVHVCRTFLPTKGGQVDLEIHIYRNYNTSGVRNYVDNVRLSLITYPALCIREERKIGTTVTLQAEGTPMAAWLALVAPISHPTGIYFPGVSGSLRLVPAPLLVLTAGTLGNAGTDQKKLPLPADTALVGVSLFFQGVQADKTSALSLGSLHHYPLVK